jgi:hypothetical protein
METSILRLFTVQASTKSLFCPFRQASKENTLLAGKNIIIKLTTLTK